MEALSKRVLICVLLFYTTYSQLLTTIAPYKAVPCSNAEPNCYTSLPYPQNVYARAGDPVLMYGTTDYYDLCQSFKYPANATCEQYFCDGDPYEIYNTTIRKFKQPGKYHISFLHFCYYCNYTSRSSFYDKLNIGKCQYYWKPPTIWYCGDQNPTLVTSYAFENYNKVYYGFNNPIFNNVPSMLNTTRMRIINGNENGTIETKISNSYYCYCQSTNRYGMLCDDYTNYWIPIRYNILPFISLVVRAFVLLLLFSLIFWPRVEQAWRDTFGKHKSWPQFINFIREFFEKLSFHVIFFMTLGIILLQIENAAPLTSPTSWLRRMNGNFRTVGWFVIFASYTVLLIIWANIYERSSTMLTRSIVATKFKVILGIFYIVDFLLCLSGIIAMNYIQFNPTKYGENYRYYLNISRAIMNVLAFSITMILSFGFLIYGLAMYRMLSQVDKEASLWKLKFTQFMLLTVPAMWVTCIWLLLYVIHSQLFIFGPWMNLYFSTFIDLSFLLLYLLMIFVLFDKKMFTKMGLCRFISECIQKYKAYREEKKRQRDLELETDNYTKQPLTRHEDEYDDDEYNG